KGAKRQTDEAESSWQKRSRPNLDETLTISQLKEHILQQDERIKKQDEQIKKQDELLKKKDERIIQQNEHIQKQDEHIQKQDERILQQNGMIKQLQDKASEVNCNMQQTVLENRRVNQEISQLRQMSYGQPNLNQSIRGMN
ncbi:1592_t:CDS:2, partial [Racocetra persica]